MLRVKNAGCALWRHHCPHLPTKIFDPAVKPSLISEYVDQYPLRQPQPAKSYKPCQVYARPTVKLDALSTSREAYVPHEVLRRIWKQPDAYKPGIGDMDMLTTYKEAFNPYCVEKTASFRPIYKRNEMTAKMDTVPTYTDAYRLWNEKKRDSMKPDNQYCPPGEPFASTTTSRDAYEFKGSVYTKSYKPVNPPRGCDIPFNDVSNYQEAYVGHPVERPTFHVGEPYNPCLDPFEGISTHQQDFTGRPGCPAESTKPCYTRQGYDLPFCPSTESRDAYTKMPLPCRFQRTGKIYVPPTGKMDLESTYHSDFLEHRLQPPKSFRPVLCRDKNDMPFDGSSVMREDYRQWNYSRMPPVKPVQMIQFSTEPMDFLSSSRLHYVSHPPVHTLSCKPVGPGVTTHDVFDAESMYNTTYTPKEICLCPARFKDPEGYVFQALDKYGHKQYRSMYRASQRSSSKDEKVCLNLEGSLALKKNVDFCEQPRKVEAVC
ncbi:stabilizer of axonemal microtubules 1 isoform X2 [Lissotriton helveticus]